MQHRIAEESEDNKEQNLRKPLVTTQFVEWSCKKFAQPMMKSKIQDVESTVYFEKEWRYLRYVCFVGKKKNIPLHWGHLFLEINVCEKKRLRNEKKSSRVV